MQIRYSLTELVSLFEGASVAGHTDSPVTGIATLKTAQAGDLSFLGNKKYKSDVLNCSASVILLPNDYVGEPKENQAFIRVSNSSLALAEVCRNVQKTLWPALSQPSIHATAVIHPTAVVHPTCTIGAFTVIEEGAVISANTVIATSVHIGRHVQIGEHCSFMPKVTIMDYCVLGNRIIIQPGVVIGADGFGYEMVNGAYLKLPQVGNVIIEDDVEIGANSTIDRARFGSTRIGKGTKIDNLVQIAHNCTVGAHCIVVAQVGVSGSTTLEDYVVLGGQAGLAGHLTIGKGSQVGAQSGINCDLAPKSYVRGTPAYPFVQAQKVEILSRRLPELFKRVSSIEDSLKHTHNESSTIIKDQDVSL